MKRQAFLVLGVLVLGTSLLAGCGPAKPSANPGGGNSGGGTRATTVPDPCSLVTASEATTALGPDAGTLTTDTHQNEANGIVTHVCDYNGSKDGAVEISVAPGSYDADEVKTVQTAYRNSQPISIGDGGIMFSLGSSSTAVEFWAHGLKIQVSSTTFSSKAPDTATSAKTLANAVLGRLP